MPFLRRLQCFGWSRLVVAGGGPEGVLLVVNPQSPASLTIANHYARLRAIPLDNLLYLPWPPNLPTTDVDTFRQRILLPVLLAMRESGFNRPHRLRGLLQRLPLGDRAGQRHPQVLGVGAAVGAAAGGNAEGKPGESAAGQAPMAQVSHARRLDQRSDVLVAAGGCRSIPRISRCRAITTCVCRIRSSAACPARDFAAIGNTVRTAKWSASGGRRYFLSMMLGVTAARGNSPAEVIAYLKRSAAADGTHPKGTIYFVRNSDVRSKVRDALFSAGRRRVDKAGRGRRDPRRHGAVDEDDVQGVEMGTATFDWKASGSTILPGAICDNFTSFGGAIGTGSAKPCSASSSATARPAPAAPSPSRMPSPTSSPRPWSRSITPAAVRWPRRSISRSIALTSC